MVSHFEQRIPSRWRRSRSPRRPHTVSLGYRRVLVAIADNPESQEAMDFACRLAAERHASITAVAVIEILPLLPIDAHMFEEEDDANRLLDQAEAVAASYGVSVTSHVVRARDAAIAIVARAKAINAELVVIGGAHNSRRSPRTPVFGRTIQEVLKKAPCRVMLVAAGPDVDAGDVHAGTRENAGAPPGRPAHAP